MAVLPTVEPAGAIGADAIGNPRVVVAVGALVHAGPWTAARARAAGSGRRASSRTDHRSGPRRRSADRYRSRIDGTRRWIQAVHQIVRHRGAGGPLDVGGRLAEARGRDPAL